jgi:hypothetical protein
MEILSFALALVISLTLLIISHQIPEHVAYINGFCGSSSHVVLNITFPSISNISFVYSALPPRVYID